jgi:HAD superfamily hydrolase (TIGR01484 family)
MRRLVFLDIDGTVVSHRSNPSSIPEPTKEAVRLLLAAGHAVAFATGRSRATARKPMEEFGIPDAVLCNGAHILFGGRNAFVENIWRPAVRRTVRHVTHEGCAAYAADTEFLYTLNAPEESLVYLRGQTGDEYTKPFAEMGDVCKLEYYGTRVRGIPAEKADLINEYGGFGVYPPGICKALGIRRFAELAGFSMRDTVAVGDGENDIGMLREAAVGVAVGGAKEEVRAAADVVADAIEEEGLLKVFSQLGLIGD